MTMTKRWQRTDGHLRDTGPGLACAVSRPEYDPHADDRPELEVELQLGEIAEPLPREADRETLGVAACCQTCGWMIDQPEEPS